MSRPRWFLLVGTLALASGCADLLSPGSQRSQLDTSRQKWQARGYMQYQFTLNALCFCAINGPVRIEVRNDSIITVTQISNGKALDAKYLPTINKLFDFVDRGIAEHAATLRVTYDPTLGFPTEIVYDGSANVADDEVTYTVQDVVAAIGVVAPTNQ